MIVVESTFVIICENSANKLYVISIFPFVLSQLIERRIMKVNIMTEVTSIIEVNGVVKKELIPNFHYL